MLNHRLLLSLLLGVTVALSACADTTDDGTSSTDQSLASSDGGKTKKAKADGASKSDRNVDSDLDTDSDSDSDCDGDTDSDTDSDSDDLTPDLDNDTDNDTDSDSDSDEACGAPAVPPAPVPDAGPGLSI